MVVHLRGCCSRCDLCAGLTPSNQPSLYPAQYGCDAAWLGAEFCVRAWPIPLIREVSSTLELGP